MMTKNAEKYAWPKDFVFGDTKSSADEPPKAVGEDTPPVGGADPAKDPEAQPGAE